jgi:hypothetical protein
MRSLNMRTQSSLIRKLLAEGYNLETNYHNIDSSDQAFVTSSKEIKNIKYKIEDALLFRREKKFDNCTHNLEETQKKKKEPLNEPMKKRDKKIWLIKKMQKDENISHLVKECIVQELHRLMDPSQPKTRILYLNNGEKALMSEKVDFTPIKHVKNFVKKIKEGKIRGIGKVSAMAYIAGDADRHNANLGINTTNDIHEMVSIDCGYSYNNGSRYVINTQAIYELPWISKNSPYKPNQFFGLLRTFRSRPNSKVQLIRNEISGLVTADMMHDESIKREKYETFLKFIILSDSLISRLTEAYTYDNNLIKFCLDYFINRKNQLLKECLKLPDFRKYCISDDAKKMVEHYISQISEFKTMKKNYLLDRSVDPDQIRALYNNCKNSATSLQKDALEQKKEPSLQRETSTNTLGNNRFLNFSHKRKKPMTSNLQCNESLISSPKKRPK